LSVRAPGAPGVDFNYVIHNADGAEVEHCGNGARCFVRFVHDRGLTDRTTVRVQTMNRLLELHLLADGRVRVDMARPVLDPHQVPFDTAGLKPRVLGQGELWPLDLGAAGTVEVAVLSMGNPHAVLWVDDVEAAPVPQWGPQIEAHPRFTQRVNAGFAQIIARDRLRLRAYERGAGETLACGTGACAAAVAGIAQGLLDPVVEVQTRGGPLQIEWRGLREPAASVFMSGPATRVFEGEIELPDQL